MQQQWIWYNVGYKNNRNWVQGSGKKRYLATNSSSNYRWKEGKWGFTKRDIVGKVFDVSDPFFIRIQDVEETKRLQRICAANAKEHCVVILNAHWEDVSYHPLPKCLCGDAMQEERSGFAWSPSGINKGMSVQFDALWTGAWTAAHVRNKNGGKFKLQRKKCDEWCRESFPGIEQ